MRFHETLVGVFFMLLAAAVFGYTFTFPPFPGQKYGPSLFPQVIAAGIFVCGLIVAARGWRSGARLLAVDEALRGRGMLSFVAMPLAVIFYLLAAERLGFLPTAAIIVAGLSIWLGVRTRNALVLGVLSAILFQWFFGTLMRVPLPRGWFMQLVAGG